MFKIHDEPESPHEEARLSFFDEPNSPNEGVSRGPVFKIHDVTESPNERACLRFNLS